MPPVSLSAEEVPARDTAVDPPLQPGREGREPDKGKVNTGEGSPQKPAHTRPLVSSIWHLFSPYETISIPNNTVRGMLHRIVLPAECYSRQRVYNCFVRNQHTMRHRRIC